MTFGEKLQELRENAGLSHAELAKRSGIPVGTIRSFEQGLRQPLWDVVLKLCDALDVTSEAFGDCDEIAGDQ
jgi:transcriptional regulator with XRE-family HTH domain